MNCKVVYTQKVVDKKTFKNYHLLTENGKLIAIKPSFTTDYSKLSVLAEKYEEK